MHTLLYRNQTSQLTSFVLIEVTEDMAALLRWQKAVTELGDSYTKPQNTFYFSVQE